MLNGGDREFRLVNGEFFLDRDGALFSYLLDFLRTLQVSLPSDFTDYQRLQREAYFYELYSMADLLSQESLLKPKVEILEIRFVLQETQAFFRVFGSCNVTIDALAGYVSIKPDHRKLINGTNVLGLLVDVLLKEGFHLVSTRTVSAEEKIECYCFERTRQPDALPIGQAQQGDAVPQTKAVQMHKQKRSLQ
ncbi:UNVERIFIED_CONTAM: hypothetical protein K2H54_042290 [Gekko kuhli]